MWDYACVMLHPCTSILHTVIVIMADRDELSENRSLSRDESRDSEADLDDTGPAGYALEPVLSKVDLQQLGLHNIETESESAESSDAEDGDDLDQQSRLGTVNWCICQNCSPSRCIARISKLHRA